MIEFQNQFQNMLDSQFHQDFQIQDAYSIFQVPQQEPTNLKKSMEFMIQSQNNNIQSQNDSFNRIEAKINQLVNMYKNEEPLPY